jgi:hypothetical protein
MICPWHRETLCFDSTRLREGKIRQSTSSFFHHGMMHARSQRLPKHRRPPHQERDGHHTLTACEELALGQRQRQQSVPRAILLDGQEEHRLRLRCCWDHGGGRGIAPGGAGRTRGPRPRRIKLSLSPPPWRRRGHLFVTGRRLAWSGRSAASPPPAKPLASPACSQKLSPPPSP